jgi:hypothetical protein
VGWDDSVGQVYNVNGGGQECPACVFLVDLALRYFVSCLYNLDGFMEPLRTGIVRGGFLCLGLSGETQGPSTPHQIRYANLMLRSG